MDREAKQTPGEPSLQHQNVADSAGVPWAGRDLHANPFSGDDGSADPALTRALAEWGAVSQQVGAARGQALMNVVDAVREVRVLVPVIAVEGSEDASQAPLPSSHAHGLRGDASADMSLVTLTAPDGRAAMPVFSDATCLTRWHCAARPVPALMRRAALSAVQEQCDLVVLDPGSPHVALLPRPAVWAVAQGTPWQPSYLHEELTRQVAGCANEVSTVLAVTCAPGVRAELQVQVRLLAGLTADQVDQAVEQLSAAISRLPLSSGIDSLEMRIVGN